MSSIVDKRCHDCRFLSMPEDEKRYFESIGYFFF